MSVAFLWILIPLAGIALAGFSEWLKFKRQTAQLGNSAVELEGVVESLRTEVEDLLEERRALEQRIRNLETIVTSEAWETMGKDRELTQAKLPLELPDPEEDDDARQIERIARRLRS